MKFDLDAMPFLTLLDLQDKYNRIGAAEIDSLRSLLDELGEPATEIDSIMNHLIGFMSGLEGMQEVFDESDYFTAVTDENGGLEKLYALAIFRDEEGLVLKAGANLFRLHQKEDGLASGEFKGTFKMIVSEGANNTTYSRLFVNFRKKGDKTIYEIPCIAAKNVTFDEGEILASLEAGTSIAPLFSSLPASGGGDYISMNDLDIGEYSVVEMKENEPHPEYGRSWRIVLSDGISFMSKGKKFTRGLETNAKIYMAALAKGKPLTLMVTEKKQLDQGVSINACFQVREPRMPVLAPAPVGVASIAPATEQRQLAAAGVDEIPF